MNDHPPSRAAPSRPFPPTNSRHLRSESLSDAVARRPESPRFPRARQTPRAQSVAVRRPQPSRVGAAGPAGPTRRPAAGRLAPAAAPRIGALRRPDSGLGTTFGDRREVSAARRPAQNPAGLSLRASRAPTARGVVARPGRSRELAAPQLAARSKSGVRAHQSGAGPQFSAPAGARA